MLNYCLLGILTPAHLEPPHYSASATPPSNIPPNPEPSTTSPASPPRLSRSGQNVHWLITFITESWPSLWWGSICGVQYTQTHSLALTLASVFAIFASSKVTWSLS